MSNIAILILALVILAPAAALGVAGMNDRRQRQRWHDERDRINGYGERRAAAASRPYGDVIAVTPIIPPTGEPLNRAGLYYNGERADLREFS